jgi:hypothetical protein
MAALVALGLPPDAKRHLNMVDITGEEARIYARLTEAPVCLFSPEPRWRQESGASKKKSAAWVEARTDRC